MATFDAAVSEKVSEEDAGPTPVDRRSGTDRQSCGDGLPADLLRDLVRQAEDHRRLLLVMERQPAGRGDDGVRA